MSFELCFRAREAAADDRRQVEGIRPRPSWQEAFAALADPAAFAKVRNGGYFVEWANGADLSADTLWHDSRETPAIIA